MKDNFTLGLETILNSKQGNFMKDTKAFNEIHKESGMCLSQMIKSIGRGSKEKKYAPPTDNERSEARLKQLETESK